jgi:murein L,D-transpeptidase YafK
MNPQFVIALIGVSSALLGTIIGGWISYLSNKNLKMTEWKMSLVKEDANFRRKLYSDFLSEVNRLTVFSSESKVESIKDLSFLINYYTQIELLSSQEIISCSKEIVSCVVARNRENAVEPKQDFYDLKQRFICSAKYEIDGLMRNNVFLRF